MGPVDKFYEWHEAEMKDLEENGPRKKRGRKPSKKQYFTYITDQAIIAYTFLDNTLKSLSEWITEEDNRISINR